MWNWQAVRRSITVATPGPNTFCTEDAYVRYPDHTPKPSTSRTRACEISLDWTPWVKRPHSQTRTAGKA